jgi:hypothetical protein
LHAAKKLAAHRALITQTTPFLADKRLTRFSLNLRFQATPDLARGLKPAAHRALTKTKQQINNQQQTTNTTPKFLLIPLRSLHPCYQGSHSRRRFLRHIEAWPEQFRTIIISRHTLRKNYNTMEKNGLTL